jgi:branched-chain amino acid transport system substrate-binding protein
MTISRVLRISALFIALTLAFAPFVPAAAADPQPFEIPVITSLTGIYAFIGKGSQSGLQGVEAVTNAAGGVRGRPIKFVFQDDGSSPQTSLQLANALIAKHAPFFLGTTATATCLSISPTLQNGPLMYCLTPGIHPAIGSWTYSANVSSDVATLVGLRYLRQRGLKRIAILAATDASGQDQERGTDAALAAPANRDFTVVAREHFAPNDVSASAQMARIKAANPQVVLLLCVGSPFGTGLHALADSGIDVPVFTSNGNSTYAGMKQFANYLPKELLFPDQPPLALEAISDKGVRDQVLLYKKAMNALGVKPDGIPATAWDPGFLMIAALKKFGFGMTADQLKGYLSTLQDYPGAMGRYDFREVPQRGLNEESVIIARWDPHADWWLPVSHPGGAPL